MNFKKALWSSAVILTLGFSQLKAEEQLIVKSEDGNFKLKLMGLLQADYKEYFEGSAGANDGFYFSDGYKVQKLSPCFTEWM